MSNAVTSMLCEGALSVQAVLASIALQTCPASTVKSIVLPQLTPCHVLYCLTLAFVVLPAVQILTPQQEAVLETSSYPWCPDLWEMSGVIAAAGGRTDLLADPLAELSMGTDVLKPLMPFCTAFGLLKAPLMARGAGLRLKRE